MVVVVPVVSAVVASIAVSSLSRFWPWAPVGALSALLWFVLVADVMTGGTLQINTPLGYTPTVAGRFQGFGNLSFGLVGVSAVVTAVLAMHQRRAATGAPGGESVVAVTGTPPVSVPASGIPPAWIATLVGAVTAVAIAAPAFGSDVGGTLAIVPTFVIVVAMIAGRRIGWKPLVATGVVSVALVVGLAALDMSRPAASRTHLRSLPRRVAERRRRARDPPQDARQPRHPHLELLVVRADRRGRARCGGRMAPSGVTGIGVAATTARARVRGRVRDGRLPRLRPQRQRSRGTVDHALRWAVPWIVASVVPIVKRAGR